MSDIMRPISIDNLFDWILSEFKTKHTVFGVREFFKADPNKTIELFGETMETPIGPAAGPQTQLAQNLISAYLTGSRFFEVKTVQILDGEDLPVSKPCISARDEGYNCEWSTELYVPQAFDEYVKAWFVMKLLSKEFNLGSSDGFIFNMSVGYDFEGIKSPKVDKYITGMQNVENSPIWKECQEAAYKYLDRFTRIKKEDIENMSPVVSKSITLSTLHGTLPEEIEKISQYLIEEKGLNTFIKCNPTLLGYDYARKTLDDLGFDYIQFDDTHFKEDLQFEDAVPMLGRLQKLADEKGVRFGVKITNTFPVDVTRKELPSEEMYMSGRALAPLALSVAKNLTDVFDGKLQISYSGGADIYSIKDIFEAGIWPITMATTMLKPGGYQRLIQMANVISDCKYPTEVHVDWAKMDRLEKNAKEGKLFRKDVKLPGSPKIHAKLPLLDCFTSPCRGDGGCPISQDVPAYLRYIAEGKYLEALKVITDKNPLPFITGTICAHPCETKCTRQFYEGAIDIRGQKLLAAEHAYDELLETLEKPEPVQGAAKTAVIGAGPVGISAGYFLARAGHPVTVFDKSEEPGGIVMNVIPEFRISKRAIRNDVGLAEFYGAEFKCGQEAPSLEELRAQGFENVIYAIGARKHNQLRLESGTALNSLNFLKDIKQDPEANPYGEHIVIVGGGNTAMDCARAAQRLPGVKEVSLVYRRDKRNMPAEGDELMEAMEEGVFFRDLLQPITLENGQLKCEVMKLGALDESGRQRPEGTGKFVNVNADTVVSAVGEKVDVEFFKGLGMETTDRGLVKTNARTCETNLDNVYVVGDANLGASTVVQGVADATKACKNITDQVKVEKYERDNDNIDIRVPLKKRGKFVTECNPMSQSERCLECSTICESCVDVCPNRANIVIDVKGTQQILHADRMCNECGNCETFCPYESAPYKDKFTSFLNEADFHNSTNNGFYVIDPKTEKVLVRILDREYTATLTQPGHEVPEGLADFIHTVIEDYSYILAE